MLSARADWLTRRWLAKYYSPPSSGRETKWLRAWLWVPKVMFWSASYSTCVVYTKTIIHFSVGESGGYLPPLQWIIVKCWWKINILKGTCNMFHTHYFSSCLFWLFASFLVITSCDFDNGLCDGWRQSSAGDFNWTLHAGATLSLFYRSGIRSYKWVR